jgi:hypothetical protein
MYMNTKQCAKCKTELPLTNFYKSSKSKDGHQTWCKNCSKNNRIQYYKDNKEREDKRNKEWEVKRREWLASLKDKPCTDCGNKYHFSAMHWDHLPEHNKKFNVSLMWHKSEQQILNEIAKCELVCANCHAYRTWSRKYPVL